MQSIALDAAGHRRSPATMPGYHHASEAASFRRPRLAEMNARSSACTGSH